MIDFVLTGVGAKFPRGETRGGELSLSLSAEQMKPLGRVSLSSLSSLGVDKRGDIVEVVTGLLQTLWGGKLIAQLVLELFMKLRKSG